MRNGAENHHSDFTDVRFDPNIFGMDPDFGMDVESFIAVSNYEAVVVMPVEVDARYVIGKDRTALPGGRHTQAQVDEHSAKTLTLVANRVPGDLSTDYNAKSHARLRSKVITAAGRTTQPDVVMSCGNSKANCWVRTRSSQSSIVNHLEMLLIERFAALRDQMIESNLLHCCTSNMMTCGGDKSNEFTANNDGTQTPHRSPACLCWAPTCIFDL
jgi:hypothetical protein